MNSVVGPAILHRIKLFLLWALTVFLIVPGQGTAQPSGPTIIDFRTEGGTLFLDISLNAEAFVAGIDPDASPDFADAPQGAEYTKLRKLVSSELEPQVKAFVKLWMATLQVEAGGPVALSYEGARIPVAGNPETVRISRVLLTGPLPDTAANLRLTWPEGHGSLVLRQQGVDAPYTGYLVARETSPLIPLLGGAGLDAGQTVQAFFPKGISRILPNGPQQILVVLTLLFLTVRTRPVVAQVLAFSLALVMGLTIGTFEVMRVSHVLITMLLPASVAALAIWNLIARRLTVWRVLAVLVAGLLHGLGLSTALEMIGVPPERVPPAVLGYGAGVILAISAIALVTFALVTLVSQGSHRLRGRISVLASMMIAIIGIYWCVEPLSPV